MTFLPKLETVIVPDEKIRDYLLNPANLQNRGKAALFQSFGFSRDQWDILANALRAHPAANEIVEIAPSPFGLKYVVRCNLFTPDGRNPCRTSVWVIPTDDDRPRLVTAY